MGERQAGGRVDAELGARLSFCWGDRTGLIKTLVMSDRLWSQDALDDVNIWSSLQCNLDRVSSLVF